MPDAVSNKVHARPEYGGQWLALDGRILFKAKVAASERYNRLGVRFVERRSPDGKRPVREIDGVDPMLLAVWSKRRSEITIKRDGLPGLRPLGSVTNRDLLGQVGVALACGEHGASAPSRQPN